MPTMPNGTGLVPFQICGLWISKTTRYTISQRGSAAVIIAFLLTGCANYDPLPLPVAAPLASSLSALQSRIPIVPPLQVSDVALLVLENSPDLHAIRAQRGVAQAQLLQAGLAPNPTVTGALLPLAAGIGTTTAWNAGLSYDIKSLITLRSRHLAAVSQAESVDASLLWQEWQTISQARLLAVGLMKGEQVLLILRQTQDLMAGRVERSRQALRRGNVTLLTTAPDLLALQTARTALFDQERLQLGRHHQMNALLGLLPEVSVPLAETPDLPEFDQVAVEHLIPDLAAHRPDLAALRLGYAAQDEKVRVAILSQFPNLSFGITGGSDNSNVRNIGPQIQLELPIFDHAQGLIANERATRQQLHDEYTARLTAATGQVIAMLSEMALQRRQLATARQDVADIKRTASQAQAALSAGAIDERSAVDLISARASKLLEIVALEQSLLEQQVAIDTLIGAGMPAIDIGATP